MHKMMIPLKRYAQFDGRASRSEYWWFQGFLALVAIPLYALLMLAGYTESQPVMLAVSGVSIIVWLAMVVPLLAVTVRRLHDVGHSGWMVLLAFIPFASIIVLVFMFLPGTPGENRFGSPVPHV